MSRILSTSELQPLVQVQQLNTSIRRSQRSQVNAMSRLANRLLGNLDRTTAPGLGKLLEGFKAFADEYATTLDNANPSGKLSFLLRSGIERLLQEWSILSRACEQRSESNPKYMRAADREQSVRYRLGQAETILATYCRSWRPPSSAAYVPLQTPVVYFEKLYRISRALFAPDIPVVSIPLSDYDAPERWQALAHEMGHHLFWNAVTLEEFTGLQKRLRQAVGTALLDRHQVTDYSTLDDQMLKRIDLWGRWLEEVFADVCGVLFAGPAFAHSAQELAAVSVNTLDDLVGADDQAHPSLYLRPLIALQVIREIAQQLADKHVAADYRQALLAWAGTGEIETQRRAPNFDEFLKTVQRSESPGGKRIPADLKISSGTILPGDVRWQLFTAAAANLSHPLAQIPLCELAADVPVVVRTLLEAPVWPDGKRLWDLINYYGLAPEEQNIQELAALEWKALPDVSAPPVFAALPDPETLSDPDLKGIVKRLEAALEAALEAKQVEEKDKQRVFWTLLSVLDIESEAAGYHKHTASLSDHKHDDWWFLFTSQHHHDPAGQSVIRG